MTTEYADDDNIKLETDLCCPNCKENLSWVWKKDVNTLLVCKNGHQFSKVIPVVKKHSIGIIHTDEFDFYIYPPNNDESGHC